MKCKAKRRHAYPTVTCRHCSRRPSCHSTGLCWRCRSVPAIRELYPSLSKYAPHRDRMHSNGSPEPTEAVPGTPEKFAVLLQRASSGLDLFARGDASRDIK
jgi:hypothetical protein